MNIYSIVRGKGGTIAWTDEQVAYIIKKYTEENYPLAQLGKEFNCSYGTIRNLLHRHKIKSRGNKQGYPRDEYYFNQIDTEEKAYWLGFLYADGCVHSDTKEISVDTIDSEHLEKFKKAIKAYNHKIGVTQDARWKNANALYHFAIKDKQLHQDLIKWGCVPQKSLKIEKIPNIPRDYVSHFLRGYFDGDGSLHYLKGTNNYRISFVGTKSFLMDIQKELGTNVSLGTTGQAYQLQISGRKQVNRILLYLYNNSSENMRLDRKYSIFLKCLEWVHQH